MYGFYDFKYPSLPATFTIDGESDTAKSYFSGYLEQANYLWFESDGLFPGSHVLSVTFDHPSSGIPNRGGRFTLDYIIYTPSFSSLETQGDSTSVVSSSIGTQLSSRQISSPTTTAVSHSESTAVLIGAPIGTIFGVLVVACLVYLFRRRIINKKIQAIARLAPDPYRNVSNSSQISGEPLIVPTVESRKGVQSSVQRRTSEASSTFPGMDTN